MIKRLFLIASVFFFSIQLNAKSLNLNTSINTPPILSNFRIEASEPGRVYFDSSEPITGSNVVGFTISLKNISSINITPDSTTGHYFKVTTSFTYWDNNTIRYEGGSDIVDDEGNKLPNFTLTYIENNIPEPNAEVYRYVTTSATGGGDGITEETAWTFEEAVSKVTSGMTVWIKAGDYGDIQTTINKSGTSTQPIKFIGYKSSTGDIISNYYDYGVTFDKSQMPTLSGVSPDKGVAIFLNNSSYIVIRNIQVTNYQIGITSSVRNYFNKNIVIDKFNGYVFGSETQPNGAAMNILTWNSDATKYIGNTNFKILNSVVINYSMSGITLFGDGQNLLNNVKAYSDRIGGTEKNDYQISINGDNNIITNCYAENINGTMTNVSTHGIGIRGNYRLQNNYNLIEKTTAVNINEGFYIRNLGCNYNVIKDCKVRNNGAVSNYRGGVYIWGGADYNIIERVDVKDVYTAIGFKDNYGEDGTTDATIGKYNIIRNCTFNNFIMGISVIQQTTGKKGALYDNEIINCNFNNGNWMFQLYNEDIQNLNFINCSLTNFDYNLGGGYVYQNKSLNGVNYYNCNFYNNNFTSPTGINNISVDPQYIDVKNSDFRLKPESELIDKGKITDKISFDFDKNYRLRGASYDIGAFEDQSDVPTAGPDVSICSGSSVILNASGGDTYLWNTGETTPSITITPDQTTTYSVEITKDSTTVEDSVIVTTIELPNASAGDDVEVCEGFSSEITLTATGGDTFLWSTGETTQSIKVSPSETTTYTVTTKNNGCDTTSEDSVTVTVSMLPDLNAGDDVEICKGSEVTLTATGAENYLWSTGETTQSITVSPSEVTTYTVTSTNGSCSISDDIIVNVSDGIPEVTASDDVKICEGESVTLTAQGVGNFTWSTGEAGNSITVNPTETTIYVVKSNNACGDEVEDSVTVTVNKLPELNAGDDVEICKGSEITLTATGAENYLWSTGETTASITVSPSEVTIYTVTSTNGSCSISDDIIVNVSGDIPQVTASDDVEICEGESVTLTAQGVGNFTWSTGEVGNSITVNPTETTTYVVKSNNACGDEVEDSVTVTVNALPAVNAGSDVTIKKGESITLNATGAGSLSWSTGDEGTSITVSPQTTTTYIVTATSDTGCTSDDTVTVTVEGDTSNNNANTDQVMADAGQDVEMCKDGSVLLMASGGDNYFWSTGETTQSITVSPSETTTYSVTVSNAISIATDEVTVFVDESCSGLGNREIEKDIKVYPNPATDILNIELTGFTNDFTISFYNLNGSVVYSEFINNLTIDKTLKRQINTSRFSRGIYFVRLISNDDVNTKKVLLI